MKLKEWKDIRQEKRKKNKDKRPYKSYTLGNKQ